MVFHSTSKYVYSWLKRQEKVKEESLTDWLLYEISSRTNRFYYKAFTRNEEATNGADWEWWVLTNGSNGFNAYRFLVQAKKLKSNQDNYPLISYGNRNGLQIDLLIDSAKQRNAMPVYMYYSVSLPDFRKQRMGIEHLCHHPVPCCEYCTNGAYLSTAQTVKDEIFDSPRKHISAVDLLNRSLPLSILDFLLDCHHCHNCHHCTKDCIDCKMLYKATHPCGDIAERIMNRLNRYYIDRMYEKGSNIEFGIKHNGNLIPNYVMQFIRIHEQSHEIESHGEQHDWYEAEFKHHLHDISGIAIIDLREN